MQSRRRLATAKKQRNRNLLYLLLTIPIVSIFVIWHEISFLQGMGRSSSPGEKKQLRDNRAADKVRDNVNGRSTLVLIANYRDTKRCAETIQSLFENARHPELVNIAIYDQIYQAEGEIRCVDEYCHNMLVNSTEGTACPRRNQIRNNTVDASKAQGPTVGRHHTEKMIQDEQFCLSIDSHLIFVPHWDDEIMLQYDAIQNPKGILTMYPKSVDLMKKNYKPLKFMCRAKINNKTPDAMIEYAMTDWIDYRPVPRLQSQLAGGFNFGSCENFKQVPNDPYTPYLFHGEEYSRAARLWTHGWDFYAPNKDICYHWYEKRKVVWERDWSEHYPILQQSCRRVRYMLGLPVSKNDVVMTDLELYGLGNKRTFEQYRNFTGIDPTAPYDVKQDPRDPQFHNCQELVYVPYNN